MPHHTSHDALYYSPKHQHTIIGPDTGFAYAQQLVFDIRRTSDEVINNPTPSYITYVCNEQPIIQNLILEALISTAFPIMKDMVQTLRDYRQANSQLTINPLGLNYVPLNTVTDMVAQYSKTTSFITKCTRHRH